MINDTYRNEKVELNVKQVAKNDAPYCGDSYFYITTDQYFLCMLADGLGSGRYAYESSNAIKEVVEEYHHLTVEEILEKCNNAMVAKRGAAIAIMKFCFETQDFKYVSVGNIKFFLYLPSTDKTVYPLPISGYLSGKKSSYKVQTFPYEPQAKFIIFSDGLELKEIKSYMARNVSVETISNIMWEANVAHADDTTFIIGSLLF